MGSGSRRETPHISVDALTKRFGAVTAVSDLSLSLEAGQIVGLLGPNGAGKTTTLHTEVPPVAVPLPMLDPEPSVVPGVGAS